MAKAIAMYLQLLLKGFFIGLSIAAPVGPIGVFCINRTLSGGFAVGLISGFGAALADAIYGCVAGFGLVSVSRFLMNYQNPIQLVGGAFLIYLGLKTFLTSKSPRALADRANSLWQDFSSSFFLTLTNPATIISFIAIYSSLGIVDHDSNYLEAMIIVMGVFSGSLFWWFFLSAAISKIKHKLSQNLLIWINRLSGSILISFGLWACGSLFVKI